MAKQIDDKQVLLTRMNEDAQKDVPELQQRLLGPVAERAQKIIKSYADEVGLAVVFDISSQANSIIYFPDVADVTTEVIRRIDADIAKSPGGAPPAPPSASLSVSPGGPGCRVGTGEADRGVEERYDQRAVFHGSFPWASGNARRIDHRSHGADWRYPQPD
jgi:hypothetical protein